MEEVIRIRPLRSIEEMYALEDLQDLIWPDAERLIVPASLQLRMANSGGVVLGAFSGERLIGFVLGFLGTDSESPGEFAMTRLMHCSHKMGVHPDFRGQGVAYHLKLAQRQAVIRQGVRLATWTYDPLISQNARLNIQRLGGICRRYHQNYYGAMRDKLNVGLPSDRLEVEWWLTSPRVRQRISGERLPLDLANFLAAGAVKVNNALLDPHGIQRPERIVSELSSTVLLLEIPHDIQDVKRRDMEVALEWRMHIRALFEEAFEAGYIVTDHVQIQGGPVPRSYYVLAHGEARLG
jgi:predicted GNAT superfamily acetyltransferase